MKNTVDEMIAILQAYKAGKEIQTCYNGLWKTSPNHNWNFFQTYYRIKPEIVIIPRTIKVGELPFPCYVKTYTGNIFNVEGRYPAQNEIKINGESFRLCDLNEVGSTYSSDGKNWQCFQVIEYRDKNTGVSQLTYPK